METILCRITGSLRNVFVVILLMGMFQSLCTCRVPGMLVTVSVPETPDNLEISHWYLRWWDGAQVRTDTRRSDGDAAFSMELALGPEGAVRTVVALTPVARSAAGDIQLAPYGGFQRAKDTEITADRCGGELATVLLRLAEKGKDPGVINVERLDSILRERVCDAPRYLDHTRLVRALAEREMSIHDVRQRSAPLHQVRVLRQEPGEMPVPWISDDTAEEPYQPAPAGAYEVFSVPIMPGEVRRLWRCEASEDACRLLVVHRTPAGNAVHRVIPVGAGASVLR